MTPYNEEQQETVLNAELVIHWFKQGKSILDFNGTVKEYFQRNKITFTVEPIRHTDLDWETLKINCQFDYGSLNANFTTCTFEEMVVVAISMQLSYLGGGASFNFLGRTRTFNY